MQMARTPKEVTDAELAVLELLWENDDVSEGLSVRELADSLYPGGGASETATVQKLCERLLGKDFVARDSSSRPATFRACVDRTSLIGRHLKNVADKLCSGSLAPLLTQLVESAGLGSEELQRLREQVDRLDKERQLDSKRRSKRRKS